ncbi:hypothetical protein TWF506_007270 [Arthrobotrys conoides]|uniref:Uncharacterized protein n=1 Tax=Arthrobotrys conoides TaxID=74498 RepID=A0AAN8NX42_9PEZI
MPKFKITVDIPTKIGEGSSSLTPKVTGQVIAKSSSSKATLPSSQSKSEMTDELRELCKPREYSVDSLLKRRGEGQAPFGQATMANWRQRTMDHFDRIEEINENLRRAYLEEEGNKKSESQVEHRSSPAGKLSSVASHKEHSSSVRAPSRESGYENSSNDPNTESHAALYSGSLRSSGRLPPIHADPARTGSRIPTTYDQYGNVQQHLPVGSTIGRKFPATYDQYGNIQHVLSHGSQPGTSRVLPARVPSSSTRPEASSPSRTGSSRFTSSQSSQYSPSISSQYAQSESTRYPRSGSSYYDPDSDPSRSSSRYTSPRGSQYTPTESSEYTPSESSRHTIRPSESSRTSRRGSVSSGQYTPSEGPRASHGSSPSGSQYTPSESSRRTSRPTERSYYEPSESSRASHGARTPSSSSSAARVTHSSNPAPPGSVTGSHKNAKRYGDNPFGTAESRRFENPYGTDVHPSHPSSSSRSHHSSRR